MTLDLCDIVYSECGKHFEADWEKLYMFLKNL